MLKLLDILQEGTIQLTPEERDRVEHLLPVLIKVISGEYLGDNMEAEVANMDLVSADGSPMNVKIHVGNDLKDLNSLAYHNSGDKKNLEDNYIFIQQFRFSPYFKGASGMDIKFNKLITGDENAGIDLLRSILKHELIHAKDPAVNQKPLKEPYDSSKPEIYYKSWAEFQTMTGQFFEAITSGIDRALNAGVSKYTLLRALDNILQYYAGKVNFISEETNDFIQGTGNRNAFQSLIKFAASMIVGSNKPAMNSYASYISQIKQYNPEGYKEFLKDLYKTVDQAKDKLKTIKEMQYINEAKRFQQLAGIISESQLNEDEIFDIEAIKKQIEDKVEQDPNLKEVVGTLASIGLVLAIPAILQGISTLIEKGNRQFTSKFTPEQIAQIKAHNKEVAKTGQGHKQYTSAVSKEIDEYAHWLHDMCLKPIEGVLYVISKIPGIGSWSWLKDESKRHKLAEAIYLVIALAIGGAGIASHAASITGVIDAVKLGDAAIDSSILANRTGLLKNLPSLISKLVT
jgi:hypothetical protein